MRAPRASSAQMQTLTIRHMIVIEDYDYMTKMDEADVTNISIVNYFSKHQGPFLYI